MDTMILVYLGVLLAAFYFLIKSADALISSSSILGERAGISKFVIGITIVAIGTSLPELFTALIAVFTSEDSAAFVLGTIIGSNISNILLIFGTLLFFSHKFKAHVSPYDLTVFLGSTAFFAGVALLGFISWWVSIIYLILFLGYIYSKVKFSDKKELEAEVEDVEDVAWKRKSKAFLVGILVLSLVGLNLSAKGVVYGIENLGLALSIPIEFLTLTTVAFATSLPELVVTIASAKKREFDLAIGNIIGSNVSNILFILGTVGIFSTISFDITSYVESFVVLLFATLVFTLAISQKSRQLTRTTAYFFFTAYLLYIWWIF